MIEFICGRACTGKSRYIIENACKLSRKTKTVLIVPEQFSFESERAVIRQADVNLDNISVLSFSRLFDAVLDDCGVGCRPFVSDFEKTVLLKKALEGCRDNLQIFTGYTAYKEFLSNVSDAIKDLKFSGMSTEDMIDISDSIGGSCGAKLHDIALISSAYDALITDRFIDPSDRLTKLFEMLCDHAYFSGTSVFFDSFTGFTGQQYKIIDKIIEQADNVTFAFSTDNAESDALNTFYNINSAIKKIKSLAHSRGVADINIRYLNENYYSNSDMRSLEELMVNGIKEPRSITSGGINVISCENARDEALAAANIVAKEVADNGYRFSDFILVARNAEEYSDFVERQCSNNGVACFRDKSIPLSSTTLCQFIFTLFDTCASATTENILKLLKTDMYGIGVYDVSLLEDYTFIWDIKAGHWDEDWELSVGGLKAGEDTKYEAEKLAKINEIRKTAIGIVKDFRSEFSGSPKKRAKAVFDHLIKYRIDKKLAKMCEELENEGDNATASVVKQSWDMVVEVLDSLVRVMEDKPVDSSDFTELFAVAAENAGISNVPQMLDEVTFGAADRIRPSKPKISIILGANQGVFPKSFGSSGLFCSSDKEKMRACGIVLDDDIIKGTIEENYLVYSMLCCPVDKVYVLYSRRSLSGETLEPSAFISKLTDNFAELKTVQFCLSDSGSFVPRTPKSAISELGVFKDGSLATVIESLSDFEEYSNKIRKISSASFSPNFLIEPAVSKRLLGDRIHLSATKFDTYHSCKTSYFLKNALKLNKLSKADLNQLQRGTVVHYVLENIVKNHGLELSELSAAQISAEVDELIHEYFLSVSGSQVLMDARFAFLLRKISAAVKNVVCHMALEFGQCDFEPKFCELVIGDDGDIPKVEYVLSDGTVMYLDGMIDRVDVYKNHVRVVDYKTGSKTFKLSDTLVGLNMQMLIYLYAFVKNGSSLVDDPKPAGILYKNAKYSTDSRSLKMSGLITSDDEIREAMEKGNGGRFIPKLDARTSSYVEPEMFGLLFKKIDSLIKEMGEDILAGDFSPDPIDTSNYDGCQYCDFASVCRSRNTRHRKAESLSNEKVIEILKAGDTFGI